MDEVLEITASVPPGRYEDGENTQPFRDTQMEPKLFAQQANSIGHFW